MAWVYILIAFAAYLVGSVPTGFLVAKSKGVDIRQLGSGNIGATNVFRFLGKPAGVFVLMADMLKGWVAVVLVAHWAGQVLAPNAGSLARDWFAICAGVAAIVGHNYTCWLNFRGGKGIATSAGVLTALVPSSLLIILCVWIVVFVASRYVSMASIAASASLPFAAWIIGESLSLILICTALAAMALYKHRSNMHRLLQGTEHRFGTLKSRAADTNSLP